MKTSNWISILLFVCLALGSSSSAELIIPSGRVFFPKEEWDTYFEKHHRDLYRFMNSFNYGYATVYQLLYEKHFGKKDVLAWFLRVRPSPSEIDTLLLKSAIEENRIALRPDSGFWIPIFSDNPYDNPFDLFYYAPDVTSFVRRIMTTFEWGHRFHERVYDVISNDKLTSEAKDRAITQDLAHYTLLNQAQAFPQNCGSVERSIQGTPYEGAFEKDYPKYQRLLWTFQWAELALLEPFYHVTQQARKDAIEKVMLQFARTAVEIAYPSEVERIQELRKFPFAENKLDKELGHELALTLDRMPLAQEIAPGFALRFPNAFQIFDRYHLLQNTVLDILNFSFDSDKIREQDAKRASLNEIARALVECPKGVTGDEP